MPLPNSIVKAYVRLPNCLHCHEHSRRPFGVLLVTNDNYHRFVWLALIFVLLSTLPQTSAIENA